MFLLVEDLQHAQFQCWIGYHLASLCQPWIGLGNPRGTLPSPAFAQGSVSLVTVRVDVTIRAIFRAPFLQKFPPPPELLSYMLHFLKLRRFGVVINGFPFLQGAKSRD